MQTGIDVAISLVESIKLSLVGYDGVIESAQVKAMLDDIKSELAQSEEAVATTIQTVVQQNSAGMQYDPTLRKFTRI